MQQYPPFCKTDQDKHSYDIARQGGWEEWVYGPGDLRAIEKGCRFDIDAATHTKDFIEQFLCVAPGVPFILYEWQWRKVIGPIFGWKRADGLRRHRFCWIEIPKKNGKSLLASAISLYMLVADGEYSPQIFNAACSRAQARVVFDECDKMVTNSPQLAQYLDVIASTKRIVFRQNAGFIQALSKEADSSEGLNGSCVVADEVHVWKGRKLFDALRYAGAARKQPLFFVITTAGDDLSSFAYDLHKQAEQIISGEWIEDSQYAFIAAAHPDDDWRDPKTHKKANPSYGLSLDTDQYQKDFEQALRFPSQEAAFRRYRLNQWVKTGEKAWLNIDEWDKCKPRSPARELRGKSCHAGLDLSSVSDLTSLVLAFPDEDGGYHLLPFFWCPLDTAYKREQRGQAPYMTWIKQGYIIGTEGNAVDYHAIRTKTNELADLYGIESIGLDRQFQGYQIQNELLDDGLNVVPFGQGFVSMSVPTKQLEMLVKKGTLRHGMNPVLRWNAQNCIVKTDPAGNIKCDKARANDKIDGIVAAIMAVGRAMSSNAKPSVYSKRGLLSV